MKSCKYYMLSKCKHVSMLNNINMLNDVNMLKWYNHVNVKF